jgi:predicted  nucleic acid-binding Zn-ribbon protein
MASRMQGNITPYVISLTLFVILFVFSFTLAVIFKTQVKSAQIQARDASEELTQMIKPNERNRPEVLELKVKHTSTGASIVGQLLAENSRLKQVINASPRSTLDAIKAEMAAAGVELGQTLLAEIRKLRSEKAYADQLVDRYSGDLKTQQARLGQIEDQRLVQSRDYESTITQLKATLTSLQEDLEIFRGQVDTQRTALEGQFDTVRSQTQRVVNELRSTVEQKDRQIGSQRKRLEELTGELISTGKSGGPDLTRESDGQITSILADESLIYIDRGRDDQIVLGMTFEVFDKNAGIVVDETGDLRGKATIEVIRMSEQSSLSRVVRLERGKGIDEDDLIANVVYDPNISYRFYVFGEFDIDDTGQVTTTDRRRVETMISQWGGQLVKKLSYNTDFLVLGRQPDPPEQLPASVFDPVKIEQVAAQKRKYQQYQDLIEEAKALSIPILNQNRFLSLVGYYQR